MYSYVKIKTKEGTEMIEEMILDNLKKSPIYNLSMCSLEDFHSNFLCWFLNLDIKKHIKVFFPDANLETPKIYHAETQKTLNKNRFDIVILNKDKIEYVIENKIKSYPTEGQLNKYQECFSNSTEKVKCLLLSLVEFNNKSDQWKYSSYAQLKNNLLDCIDDIEDVYYKRLIQDYIDVITVLANVFPQKTEFKYNFYEDNQDLEKLGLIDIYRKYRTSELLAYLKELSQNCNSEFIKKIEWHWSYHNKKGTLDIQVKLPEIGEDDFIGIQIEGFQYRYVLNLTHKDKANMIKLAQNIQDNKWWFSDDCKYSERGKIYKGTGFCGYGKNFMYKYCDLKELFKNDVPNYDDISDKVLFDINRLNNNYQEIIDIIKSK